MQEPAPISRPPEPFAITAADLPSTSFLTTAMLSFGNAFSTPKLPEGFEIAKIPTFGEKLTSSFGSFFGLFTGSSANPLAEAPPPPPPPAGPVFFDFEGDGKSDRGRWHPNTQEFKVKKSSDGAYLTYTLGTSSSAKAAPGDYNGDGNTDAGVFNAATGVWTYKTSTGGSAQTVTWGMSGDIPVSGKYDSDSKTDFAVYRPSTGYWWVTTSGNGSFFGTAFGTAGDIPVPGDYDGDGKSDLAVFRPSNGNWYIQGSTSGYFYIHWGIGIDTPVPADYDGDGKTDFAVFRPTSGDWYAYKSSTNNGTYLTASWGNYGDQPAPGYYDGDSKADFTVWRPTTGTWYTINSYDSSYNYQILGVPGDQAVTAAYIKQVGSTVSTNDVNAVRLSPKNATGGTDLYSQNFSWGTGLVSLPGRSGLDAGFSIGYNSLVWIRQGNSMLFDPDTSNISPGFRFGFPTIEPVYYSDEIHGFAYMMVTPSGGRVQFRQTAVGNTYETADSSYAQLVTAGASSPNDPVEEITIKVLTTDGTQMSYVWKAGAFRCTKILDRNGNYTSNTYDDYGTLTTVTDTLGRVITVNQDGGGYPTSVTQTWKDDNGHGSNVTHNWARFEYTSVQIDTYFKEGSTDLNVFGPPDGTNVKVLQKVKWADNSYTTFDYNTWGQVKQINTYAADNHKLSHIAVNLPATASIAAPDCPRVSETISYVENFNSGNPVTIHNDTYTNQSFSLPGSLTGSGTTKIQVWMEGHPDNLRTNTFVASSGWKEGLPLATEDCLTTSSSCSDRKRWTWTDWRQDNEGVSYPLNPRVTQSRIGDTSNTKKTTIDYRTVSGVVTYGLPETIKTYDTDLSTVLKQSYIQYNLDSEYTSKRIIGLPSQTEISGRDSTGLNLVSRVSYAYDDGNFSDSSLSQNISPVQHDNTNYSSSFVTGRGNLTSTTRWNVDPAASGDGVTTSQKYNTAGGVVAQTDPRGRVIKVLYADDWNDGVSRTTYAFPTTITDSGGFSSTAEYRFDMGANVWARSPTPYSATSSNTNGRTTSRTYDDTTGRVTKEKIENTDLGAYKRYAYASDGITLDTYTTVVDANGDSTINGSDEVRTTTLLDGAGRVRKARTENPNSTGGYTGSLTEYDILGRVSRSTISTEINSSWNPAGDDYRGMTGSNYNWLWNAVDYDWKGRITKETNTDGTDRLYSYEGCGCAGQQITTIKGEVTEAIDDANGTMQTTKRRTQKVYADILGRTVKTEMWDLDGGGSAPYGTTVSVYNGRDQVKSIIKYAGAESAGNTHQDTTMSYDGHGRLLTRHNPTEASAASTSFTYNADDSVATVTDPRGAVATYKYGHADDSSSSEYRGLLTKVSYSVPSGSGIAVPADIAFEYDAAGNRQTMTDGSGTHSYSYDELSRLKVESKTFADALTNAPSGGYKLTYNYYLTGGLKSIQAPGGEVATYDVDKLGRTTAIGGDGFSSGGNQVTSFASDIVYRAFGSVKSMTKNTTDPTYVTVGYDSRLRPSEYRAVSDGNRYSDIQNRTYSYNNDGRLKQAIDNVEDEFNRYFDYDFAGRIKRDEFGTAAAGPAKPYKETLAYNQFGNITSRSTRTWGNNPANFTATYANNRKTSGGFGSGTHTYDSAGNLVSNHVSSTSDRSWTYDASGQMSAWTETTPYFTGPVMDSGAYNVYDGDGRLVKRVDRRRSPANGNTTWVETPEYSLFSSVTGNKMVVIADTGSPDHTYVYLGNSIIADQQGGGTVVFKDSDPVLGSVRETDTDGLMSPNWAGRIDSEALGATIPNPAEEEEAASHDYRQGGNISNPETGCEWNGAAVDCGLQEVIAGMHEVVGTAFGRDARQTGRPTLVWHNKADKAGPDVGKEGPDTLPGPGTAGGGWWGVEYLGSRSAPPPDIRKKIGDVVDLAKTHVKNNEKCAEFLNKVIAELNASGKMTVGENAKTGRVEMRFLNISEILDLTAKAPQIVETGESGITIDGSVHYTNDLRASPGRLEVNDSFFDPRRPALARILPLIHDSFHQLEGATDWEIARAARVVDGDKPKTFSRDAKGQKEASMEFNRIMGRYCGEMPTSAITTTFP